MSVSSSAPPVIFTTGHIDAIDIDYVYGALSLNIRNVESTPIDDDLSAAGAEFHALPDSRVTVPSNPAYAFLGSPGDSVWVLPQTLNQARLSPGWDTEDIPVGALVGDIVQLNVEAVTGPGRVIVYTVDPVGEPQVRLDSDNPLPAAIPIQRGVHTHGNWAFTAAGTYTVTFRATGTAAATATTPEEPKQSAAVVYTFVAIA
jgi:surface-anchored protein